ncbi:MAG: threonylcarbamoyl-AMP synthase [Actinobacteria bacterium]|nr:MAG: threonylcarbamoyl-AMP synthase [Actinomycetota bacterium]
MKTSLYVKSNVGASFRNRICACLLIWPVEPSNATALRVLIRPTLYSAEEMISSTNPATPCNIVLASASGSINIAVQTLRGGGIVAVPTETVYGLGAALDNETAIAKVFSVKARPSDHPLIVHIADESDLRFVAQEVPLDALKLARSCWPGPLTLLLSRTTNVPLSVTGGRATVGIRVPSNEFTRALIGKLEAPIAAPSANRFGKVSPTTAQHVCDDLGHDVDLIVDDGACSIGVESTIVDFTVSPPQLLRPGGIPVEDIESILGYSLQLHDGLTRASGMLETHYQPLCQVVLAYDIEHATTLVSELKSAGKRVRLIHGSSNLPVYAATLFSQMRQADRDQIEAVVAIIPAPRGLGMAISDRLRKAAGPISLV